METFLNNYEYLMQLEATKIKNFCNTYTNDSCMKSTTYSIEIDEYINTLQYDDCPSEIQEYIYVLSIDSKAIGLLKVSVFNDTASLHHVMIRRAYRGLGHGKRLLIGSLLSFFEEHNLDIVLHVSGSNSIACHLYEELGFTIIEALPTPSDQ